MNRRHFIHLAQSTGLGIMLYQSFACSRVEQLTQNEVILLNPLDYQSPALPAGQRLPFGWPALGILPGKSVLLKPDKTLPQENLWFRITVAQEIWDTKLLHLHLAGSDTYLGAVDIRFSSVLVPYELEIDKKHRDEINRDGIRITLESPSPLWFFCGKRNSIDNSSFQAHILATHRKGTLQNFFDCFLSINSIQAFGWREGTVLDGLWQLYSQKGNKKALQTIQQHFDLFFDDKQNLVYENAGSKPNDNHLDGIESTIPFATLARLQPHHPILKTVLNGWLELEKENGIIIDGTMVSAEGCYTVAYPMAVIGKAWQDQTLMQKALDQLKQRFVLVHNNTLYLRYFTEGRYSYPNWARGAAWTLLGFARTISELKDQIQDELILAKFKEAVEIAVSLQREDGLWNCFMHDPASLPDTSGSAGISAAILTAITNGFLDEKYRINAEKCWIALQNYFTPDGFLKGVAQDNRGGMELQQSDYRVIAQMGMGMLAQLYAYI